MPELKTTDEMSGLRRSPENTCCGFRRYGGMALVLVAVASTCAASYFAGRAATPTPVVFPPIDATAAVNSENYSMATGDVSEDAEGLFVLDHNSGLLQCSVIYPRAGRFMASFTAQVGEALAVGGKGGNYVMLTGRADFPRSSSTPAAPSVVYVLDTATGNYACYGIPFNKVFVSSNRPQAGALVLIATGSANPILDRDAIR
ncbi:hypothetical protein [Novipirellula artificiosorum]|uniref:Uncharacterized protein n=1 Tax=Novipirellula artificiosorum TaxID=2528016 RepID=A0A5C6DM83_9BACT|nr:hypothetical protein [Novipirellula artificiosorum]TWU37285.1 hypothetical protein Poly41_34140 [Novipirellula artificiosorum]